MALQGTYQGKVMSEDNEEDEGQVPQWDGALDDQGKPHGTGTMLYVPSGDDEEEESRDTFEGSFEHGMKSGKGVYTFASGAKYEGEYAEDKKAGYGVFTYPDGSKYEGQWANDKRNGHGKYTYSNGDVYDGGFSNGRKHGKGTYFFQHARMLFRGEWNAGMMTTGTWELRNGSCYEGNFRKNQPSGEGTFRFKQTGNVLPGEWRPDGTFNPGPVTTTMTSRF